MNSQIASPAHRIALVFAIVFGGPVFARSALSRAPVFAELRPGLFRSSAPKEADFLARYPRLGIKTLVTLQGGDFDERSFAKKFVIAWWQSTETPAARRQREQWAAAGQINLVKLPVNSTHPTVEDVERLERAADYVMDPANQPVVFHCAFGIDRSGGLQFMIRIKYDHWSFERAYAEWQANGHYGMRLLFTGRLDTLLHEWAKRYTEVPHCAEFLAMKKSSPTSTATVAAGI